MKPGRVKVGLKGMTPLLMNRLVQEDLMKKTKKVSQNYDFDVAAKKSAYITTVGKKKQTLYVPSEAVFRCLLNTAKFYKAGKFRASRMLAGAIKIEPEKIPLNRMNYEVDVRPVVIQKARVLRARAKVPNWRIDFEIVFDKTVIPDPSFIKDIFEDAGTKSGLLDYRPERGGQFGTFTVDKFESSRK